MTRNSGNTVTGPAYAQHPDEVRQMPWHVMGEALKPSSQTNLRKALKDAGLDYTVETWDLDAKTKVDGKTLRLPADRNQAIVRPMPDGEMKVVGVTGLRFTPIQNPDAFAVATDLVGDFGARIDGLADFRHGGASVMALALPDQEVVLKGQKGHQDRVSLNLLVKNAHDGSSALTFAITPVRLDCTNVLPMAIKDAQRVWKINHTPNAQERVNLARHAILEAVGFHDAIQAVAQSMLDTKMMDAEFARMVERLVPVKDDAEGAVAERKRETRSAMMGLYRDSITLDGIRGTVWGGYNAVTEYLDHYRPVKGDEKVARAEGQIEGPNVRVKGNMWDLFSKAAA